MPVSYTHLDVYKRQMQHHWLSAIRAEYQAGEEIWFVHLFCGPFFVLTHLLHDLPLLL